MKKQRIDILLVERGLCRSRGEARRLVMEGRVRIGSDHVITKAGYLTQPDADVRVHRGDEYVSRGAYKLLPALDAVGADLNGLTALDIGASTGGFTDVLLRRGVCRVYAVDVGYGQLHYRLRQDPRVVCLERTNARYLTTELIPEGIGVLTADVSFISLTKVLPACAPMLLPGAWIFVLVKPQFEAERGQVGKGGVVRDEEVRRACVERVIQACREDCGWVSVTVVPSPIKGPKGNQEFLAVFRHEAAR